MSLDDLPSKNQRKQAAAVNLPAPECVGGYTNRQIEEIVGTARLDQFWHWMRGQTMMLCEGKKYNHDTKQYEEACGGVAHGGIVYACDLRGFLSHGIILD